MRKLTPIDVLDGFKVNTEGQGYFKELVKADNGTHLYHGNKSDVFGEKPPLANIFSSEEEVVKFFVERLDARQVEEAPTIAKGIVYNLLHLKIANEFIKAAKDIKLNSHDFGEETFNINVLGPKYQTGGVSLSDNGRGSSHKLSISFNFGGAGDGINKRTRNQDKLGCLVSFLNVSDFNTAYRTNNVEDIAGLAPLKIKLLCKYSQNNGSGGQQTLDTIGKKILTDIRALKDTR